MVHNGWAARQILAGAEGIEPPLEVLETSGLPLTDAPTQLIAYS